MKKLPIFILTLWCGVVTAQNARPQNSLALVVGPNWFYRQTTVVYEIEDYEARTGYTAGAEYTIEVSTHWHLKAGIRYNEFNFSLLTGPLTWPSEYATGQYVYDPTLPHYVTTESNIQAWQYAVGLRWISRPATWRFYFDAESGLTDFKEQNSRSDNKIRLSLGAGCGLAWQPRASKLAIFAQPVVRYVFQPLGNDIVTPAGFSFLIPVAEAGARYYF